MDPITGRLILKAGRDKPVRQGHPWLFSGAIQTVEGQIAPGDLVQVVTNHGRILATAYYNPHSQIQARILSWDPQEAIDDTFWLRRLERALDSRKALPFGAATNAYRLVNAEADGLPGLVVDLYGRYLIMQCLTLAIDRRKELIARLLADLLQPAGIYERSDVAVRTKEGLPQQTGPLWGPPPPEEMSILENNLKFWVQPQTGHKTGFYLDQRENRAAVCRPLFVNDKNVLNVFAYTGGFGIYAAAHGARQVTHIDSSYTALTLAEKTIALNGWSRPSDEYIAGDAFDILRHMHAQNQLYDVIILDPPKFAHSKADIERACRGYKDLNMQAMQLLVPGGLLATFSCSGHVSPDLFQKVLFGAAIDAGKTGQILQQLGQAPDHPISLTFPESAYLKGFLCRIW